MRVRRTYKKRALIKETIEARNEFESQVCRVWLMIGVAAAAHHAFSFLCAAADTEFNSISQTQCFYASFNCPSRSKHTHTRTKPEQLFALQSVYETRLLNSASTMVLYIRVYYFIYIHCCHSAYKICKIFAPCQ